ncbi:uncharacterized protein PgNI_01438, partial [Pyricularia grisea]|uniref:Uncharacterized protein n=1 Tax=Pyricularia grisea TaxID=148305 RepID=A0A6P8BGF8_PYRGI
NILYVSDLDYKTDDNPYGHSSSAHLIRRSPSLRQQKTRPGFLGRKDRSRGGRDLQSGKHRPVP